MRVGLRFTRPPDLFFVYYVYTNLLEDVLLVVRLQGQFVADSEDPVLVGGQRGPGHVQALSHLRSRHAENCLLYTSPSPRDRQKSRMPSSA